MVSFLKSQGASERSALETATEIIKTARNINYNDPSVSLKEAIEGLTNSLSFSNPDISGLARMTGLHEAKFQEKLKIYQDSIGTGHTADSRFKEKLSFLQSLLDEVNLKSYKDAPANMRKTLAEFFIRYG